MTWRPDVCIYHGNCQDGFGAAWAVWKRWPTCVFLPAFYGKPLPNIDSGFYDNLNVLFVDFSAPADQLRALNAKSVVVIDHHETAEADLKGLPTFDGSLEALDYALPPGGIAVHFDMERSGAFLTWLFCHDGSAVPKLLMFIQDRDLWLFKWEGSREIWAFLSSHPFTFELWSEFASSIEDPARLAVFIEEGKAVSRVHQANVKKLLADAYIGSIDGHDVPLVNAPYYYASDVGNDLLKLYPDAPFAGTWYRRADGKLQISLRSTNDRMAVSPIAKAHGGGGHRNAAGFEIEPPVWLS